MHAGTLSVGVFYCFDILTIRLFEFRLRDVGKAMKDRTIAVQFSRFNRSDLRFDILTIRAGLAIWIVFFDVLTLALGRDMVPPWMLDIRRSAQADGLPGLEERTSRAINSQDEVPFLAHISGESFLTWPLPFKMNRVNRRGGVERVACD